jgi:hypothetical protein
LDGCSPFAISFAISVVVRHSGFWETYGLRFQKEAGRGNPGRPSFN